MRKFLLILLLGVLALLIPGTVFRTVFPQLTAPNLLVVLLVYLAFYEASAVGALLAFLLGLQLDFCSGTLLGPWAGSYVIVFALLVLCSRRIFIESGLVVCLAVGIAALMTAFAYHVMLVLVYGMARVESAAISTALVEAGLSALLAPFLFFAVRWALPRQDLDSGMRRTQMLRG